MSRLFALLVVLAPLVLLPGAGQGYEPDEILDDPLLEARARDLSREIRCLVCQNESIDSSNADLARELRILVRERLVAGDSDQEVFDYLVSKYGDFVLLRPPVRPGTYLLWFGPFLLLMLGAAGVWFYFRRQRGMPATAAAPLSEDEQRRLARLLSEEPAGPAPAAQRRSKKRP